MADKENLQTFAHPPPAPPIKKARTSPEPKAIDETSRVTEPVNSKDSAVRPEDAKEKTRDDSSQLQRNLENTKPNGSDPQQSALPDPLAKDAAKSRLPPMISPLRSKDSPKSRIPPMLSPLHSNDPPKSRIPPMLSPLPANVQDEIAKMTSAAQVKAQGAGRSKTAHVSPMPKPSKIDHSSLASSDKPSTAKESKKPPPAKSPQEHRDRAVTPRPTSKETASGNITTPKPSPNAVQNGQSASNIRNSTPDAHKRMRLRVVLKIKKKTNRKPLMQYLNMKPTPGRNSLFPGRPIEKDQRSIDALSNTVVPSVNSEHAKLDRTKQEPKINHLEGPKTGEKRSRAHLSKDEVELESEPSAKRKASGKLPPPQKPSTPKIPPTSSPALSHLGSAQKRPTSAPNNEANGKAMSRVPSSQGTASTPHQPDANGTPTAPDVHSRRRSNETPGKPKLDDMKKEGNDYAAKAVKLKHEADVYLKKKESMTEDDRKRGLAIGTESVLCFVLAFTFLDSVRAHSDRKPWESILPYLVANLQVEARRYKHLSGLLIQIEAVIRDQISFASMQFLDKNPVEHELSNHQSDAIESNEVKFQRRAAEYQKQFSAMHNNFRKAQSAWRDGCSSLNVADLSKHYPATWAKRDETKQARGKEREVIKKGEYIRSFSLPMTNMTSGMEAVNFGLDFLTEWSQEEKVDWKPKLVL